MELDRKQKIGCFTYSVSLFENTPEEIYPDLAPHLCLIENPSFDADEDTLNYLHKSEKVRNAVIWLWSSKNGREVLFRFYDPRVMPAFFNILQEH